MFEIHVLRRHLGSSVFGPPWLNLFNVASCGTAPCSKDLTRTLHVTRFQCSCCSPCLRQVLGLGIRGRILERPGSVTVLSMGSQGLQFSAQAEDLKASLHTSLDLDS